MLPCSPNPINRADTGQSCADLAHELASVMTAVLMNSQVLDWKLPPYSRLKRPVREIERNAQRGGELLKRLQRQLAPLSAAEGSRDNEFGGAGPAAGQDLTPSYGDGAAPEPDDFSARQAKLPPAEDEPPAPVFSGTE